MVQAKAKPNALTAPVQGDSKVALYVEGRAVVLTYREQMLIKHLEGLRDAEKPVRAVHKGSLEYPSFMYLAALESFGAASKEKEEVERGRPPIGYSITERGRLLLQQYNLFALGQLQPNPHKCRELISYWQQQDPNRLIAYCANVLMGNPEKHGLIEAEATVGNMPNLVPIKEDPNAPTNLLDPVAQACVDMVDLVGVGLAPERFGTMPNPHSANETRGGSFSIRLTGFDAHNRAIIAEYLGTDAPTYMIQWLLQLGAFVALRQMHNEEI